MNIHKEPKIVLLWNVQLLMLECFGTRLNGSDSIWNVPVMMMMPKHAV